MRKSLVLSVSAAVVTSVALFAATEVGALSNTCVGSPYTITFINGKPTPGPQGTLNWQYKVQSDKASIQNIKEAVMVVPFPVTPQDMAQGIKSQTPGNFCEEADSNTKINRGNCDGFPVHITPAPDSSTSVLLTVVTTDTIQPGIVTINVVTGSGGSNICVDTTSQNKPPGIPGPGNTVVEVNPFAVIATTTVFTTPEGCRITVTKDSKDHIVSVDAGSCTLKVNGGPISDIVIDNMQIDPQHINFVSAGNGVITIIGSASSPGCTWIFDGSGRYWQVCV